MDAMPFLTAAVAIFVTAIGVTWLFRLIKAPTIMGFLVTGLIIGPSGLGIASRDEVSVFADIGLVLLLFVIGLELSLKPVAAHGRGILIAAAIQMGGTIIVAMVVARFWLNFGWLGAIVLGVIVCLSSTPIVLKHLIEKGEDTALIGRLTVVISMTQDILSIGFMAVLPAFVTDENSAGGDSVTGLAMTVFAAGIIIVVTRKALPYILKHIVTPGGQEFITVFAVLMALGGAWLAGLAGWSLALGACISGLLLGGADVRHQAAADILPFRDVFISLFFISMGMMLDADTAVQHLRWLPLAVVATIVAKSVIATVGVMAGGWSFRPAVVIGIGLCTISEFGYILALEATRIGIYDEPTLRVITAYVVGTMFLGALAIPFATPTASFLGQLVLRDPSTQVYSEGDASPLLSHHVVVVGYGVNGRNVGQVLRATHIPFSVVEMNSRHVAELREWGVSVTIGDAARMSILLEAGIERARAIVVAINDPGATSRAVAQARNLRPDIYILARTRFDTELDELYRLGANRVISEDFETSIEIVATILKQLDIPDNVVEGQIAAVRAGRYGMLRGRPTDRTTQEELLRVFQLTATRTHYLTADSPVAGKTLAESDIRAKSGTTIIAVVRDGQHTTNPPPDFQLLAGDILVMVGAHVQLEAARKVLERRNRGVDSTEAPDKDGGGRLGMVEK